MHALLEPGIGGALGIEIDRIKCDKAAAFLRQALAELRRRGLAGADRLVPPEIRCSPIEQVGARSRHARQKGAASGGGL